MSDQPPRPADRETLGALLAAQGELAERQVAALTSLNTKVDAVDVKVDQLGVKLDALEDRERERTAAYQARTDLMREVWTAAATALRHPLTWALILLGLGVLQADDVAALILRAQGLPTAEVPHVDSP